MRYCFLFILLSCNQKLYAESALEYLPSIVGGVIAEAQKSEARANNRTAARLKYESDRREFKENCPELEQVFKKIPDTFNLEINRVRNSDDLDAILSESYLPFIQGLSEYLEVDFDQSLGNGEIQVQKCIELTKSLKDENRKKCMLEQSISSKCASLYFASYSIEKKYQELLSLERRINSNRSQESFMKYFFKGKWLPGFESSGPRVRSLSVD